MKTTKFVTYSALIVVLFMLPFIGFVSLKYNGLSDSIEDIDSSSIDPADSEEEIKCRSLIQFGDFKRFLNNDSCYAFYCTTRNECAVIIGAKDDPDRIEYGQTSAALGSAAALFEALEDEVEARNEEAKAEEEAEREEVEAENAEELAQSNFIRRYAAYLTGIDYGYPLWQWAAIFSIAVTFCALGFITSLLTRDGRRFEQSENRNVLLLALFSSVTGVLVVTLFAGGILQGTIFPNFSGDLLNYGFNSWIALKFRGQDWFKLALWAYISGFYERFLPSILTDLIQKQARDEKLVKDGS